MDRLQDRVMIFIDGSNVYHSLKKIFNRTDLDFAIEVINRVCKEMAEEENWAKVIRTVPQVLRVDKLGDSGIDIKIIGDVKPLEQWNVTGQLRLRLKREFDKAGIEIPWPHTKVYFSNKPGD